MASILSDSPLSADGGDVDVQCLAGSVRRCIPDWGLVSTFDRHVVGFLAADHAGLAADAQRGVVEHPDGLGRHLQVAACLHRDRYGCGRSTADWMFSTAYAKDAPWNDTSWNNSKFNDLLIAARSELDEKKRRAMYEDMQELVRDNGGVIVPMFSADLSACNEKIGHGPLAVNWELDGNKAPERWWFKG